MVSKEKIVINLTTNSEHFSICAQMMVKTNPWIRLEMNFDQCLKAFEGSSKEIYVLQDENEIAGFVILQIGGTFKGYIQTICVGENYRGKGFGKKLLAFCEERILKISPNIFICVSSFNEGAIKLYYEFGFKLVGELKDFVKEGFTELLLRKTFGPIINYPVQQV
ncbi:MAG: GNAT family N-acetyltransferase [Flavobacterium sp.]|uniref:GNAT family N-acetyltransferase n=1 Tax=Flavobacterium sp. TaxID=239 RepID=UPI0026064E16|nr:GNAT family N-acetyltransferase [Flavobacterium sp.]MDD5151667.1 GNAT family N-acetyltransferase [Flavobacterium sp.]